MLRDRYPFYVANRPESPNADLVVTNKYTGEAATRVALASPADIDRAIAAAVEAADPLRRMASHQRRDVLQHCVDRFTERAEELAVALCIEAGKPIRDARNADLPLVTRLAPWLLLDTVPMVKASIGHAGTQTNVQMSFPNGTHLFSADIEPGTDGLQSEIFDSVDEFSTFIKEGVTSYAPSIYPDRYTKVDLVKEDRAYDVLDAAVEHSALSVTWKDANMEFDSAVHASGAAYEWTYRGLWSA